ncbi:MAG TPA: enoyl-CoA hydratase/isomerase family protein [Longimicrobiales bacterium]|nr:enoyl-CoA hydratase/isomerase family protein [Longimicrobiales bacterium]
MTEVEPVLSRREGPVLVLTLNRPDRLNAVSLAMYRALDRELKAAAKGGEVRAVVLTGAGRAFCVGADLKAHGEGPPTGQERREYVDTAQRVNRRIQLGPLPVVAAVNGHAIGGGLELALSADFLLVSESAKLRFPEVSLGTFVGGGVVYTLAERVGVLKARELLYFGDFFLGTEAAAMGVANRALPTEEVLPTALAWAGRLTEQAPRSLAAAKRLVGPAGTMARKRALAREGDALLEIFGTRDWAEGVAAFHEKRPPRYTGE